GRWKGRRPVVGYTVQRPEHWAFEGTGLERGDVFGADPTQPVVGYECDSAPFKIDADGTAVIIDPVSYATPATFEILGLAELNRAWSSRKGHSATMGAFSVDGGGEVFNAATTDWVKLLDRDPAVTRITRNVLNRFARLDP
ncbi:MAG TPA: N,N-dimethylformamidase beta subunit family domain-containing protein, partial [Polyangiaceae bacterium]|nr:N,N-dimethylformamidase beta subunit family domain-containing protein [Polyangiaceae bacterium]